MMGKMKLEVEKGARLLSLDALRGFDMLFIMGLTPVVMGLCNAFGFGDGCWLARQMRHVDWHGFAQHDTIFPLFLFIAGVAFPFSYAKMCERGWGASRICGKIAWRAFALVMLGMVYNGLFTKGFGDVRWASVLGRIGLAWAFAALLYLAFSLRTRIMVAVGLLVGYWAFMRYAIVPNAPAGADPWSAEWNLAAYVDRALLPNPLGKTGADPEGILSTFPAVVTAMFGMFTGEFVRWKGRLGGGAKTLAMLAVAAILLVVGLVWSNWMPINKKLWTSTFVLVAGAYSLALFAAFYWIVDVKMWRRWTFFFRVVGMNAITVYLLQRIVDFDAVSKFFVGGVAGLLSPAWACVLVAAGHLAACWLALWFLYRKNAFFKV
jgi:predicted acyltransferase